MNIRKAIEKDCPGIARVQVDSYRTAYAPIFPSEYLEHFTYEEQEGDWRRLLAAAEPSTVQYVAVDEAGEVVGYALGVPSDELPPYGGNLTAMGAVFFAGFPVLLFLGLGVLLADRSTPPTE